MFHMFDVLCFMVGLRNLGYGHRSFGSADAIVLQPILTYFIFDFFGQKSEGGFL